MAKAAVRTNARLKVGGKDQAHHWWWFALLGIVLIAGGTFMLGNLAAATVVSTIFIGATFLVLGAFQIVKAFYDSWGPGRMVWASDWPSLLPHHSYRQALQVLRDHADFLSPAELEAVQGGNLERILADRGRAHR